MDAAWAVVIGSGIGALGTLAGTTFGSYLSDRRNAQQARNLELRGALEEVVLALITYAGAVRRQANDEMYTTGERVLSAAARLGLHLRPGQSEVDTVVVGSYAAMSLEPRIANTLAGDLAQQLPAWYRGDISLSQLTNIKRHWPPEMIESERRQKQGH